MDSGINVLQNNKLYFLPLDACHARVLQSIRMSESLSVRINKETLAAIKVIKQQMLTAGVPKADISNGSALRFAAIRQAKEPK